MKAGTFAGVIGAACILVLSVGCTADPIPPTVQYSAVPTGNVAIDKSATLTVDPIGTDGNGQVTATFSKGKSGRPVYLQRKVGDAWENVTSGPQDGSGKVDFAAPSGVNTYRAVAVAFSSGDQSSEATATDSVAADEQYHPLLAEDFNAGTLDDKVWSPRMTDVFLPSRTCSAATPDMLAVKDGNLAISVQKADPARTAAGQRAAISLGADASNPCPYGVFDNGHVSTQDKLSFTYGLVAVRLKLPAIKGEHAAAWLQSYESNGDEIDFLESFGKGKGIQYKLHSYGADGKVISSGGYIKSIPAVKKAAWWNEYHIGSLEWTKDEYIFRVDGEEVYRTSTGISQTKKYLILSLLTSDWELPLMDSTKLPSSMDVDWVRIWQK